MFETELDYFVNNQERLVAQYRGKVLVIKGSEVVGAYENHLRAYEDASSKFEPGTFMIQSCEPGPAAYTVTIASVVTIDSAAQMADVAPAVHAFSAKGNGLASRLITDVQVTAAYDPAKIDPKTMQSHACKALWDTGASRSVISPDVVKALNLTPTGAVNISHAGGNSTCNTYMVNIGLPNGVGIVGIQASEFHGQDGFEVIVGMDVITMGDFSVTNANGKTCMSFRIPSIEEIDYVAMAREPQRAEHTPGRNSPCPCGKTQRNGQPVKYKNCCGK